MKKWSVVGMLLFVSCMGFAQQGVFDYDKHLDRLSGLQQKAEHKSTEQDAVIDLGATKPQHLGNSLFGGDVYGTYETRSFSGVYNWFAPREIDRGTYVIYTKTTYSDTENDPVLLLFFELKEGVNSFPAEKITFRYTDAGLRRVGLSNTGGYEMMNGYQIEMVIENNGTEQIHLLGLKV